MGNSTPLGRAATYKDLCAVSDHLVAELIDGDLWATPRPAIPHAHAAMMLGVELGAPFGQGRGGPGGWWILPEPEIHFHDDVVVPDFAGWRRDRLPGGLGDLKYMTLRPDWVCEILSPSTERLDREKKLRVYASEGVSHVWLVNPTLRTLEAMRLANGRWTLLATLSDDAPTTVEPFDAAPFPLSRIWLDR